MSDTEPADTRKRPLRRILVVSAIVLGALILLGVAIYAAAFLILAPMMQ